MALMTQEHLVPLQTKCESGPHERLVDLALTNSNLSLVLNGLHALNVDDCWVASGCIVQSVWNALCGNAGESGIVDYDVIYFDPDTSWEAEDRVIQRGRDVFAAMTTRVEIRNQARVHAWFRDENNRPVSPLTNACASLWRYPSRTTAIALTMENTRTLRLCAPFGIRHALEMRVVPNRRMPQPQAYAKKVERWKQIWPKLTVEPLL